MASKFLLFFAFVSFLETRAVIQRPEVRFLSSNLDIEDCFVNVPAVKIATMQNLTLFSVQYKWLEVKNTNLLHLDFLRPMPNCQDQMHTRNLC